MSGPAPARPGVDYCATLGLCLDHLEAGGQPCPSCPVDRDRHH